MNIFAVDKDPKISAQQLCDKHVVKMILESAQMLCSAYPNGDAPYKRAFYNHPCTIWARESQENYEWLLDHAYAMCQEYTRRYGKVHKSIDAIEWCGKNYIKLRLPRKGLTKFAQAMPEQYKNIRDFCSMVYNSSDVTAFKFEEIKEDGNGHEIKMPVTP